MIQRLILSSASVVFSMLFAVAGVAQTDAGEKELQAIAQRVSDRLEKLLPGVDPRRIALAPFFFNLKNTSYTLWSPDYRQKLTGSVTALAAETIRQEIADGLEDLLPPHFELIDGNEVLADELDAYGLPRRYVRDSAAAAGIALAKADYVITAVIKVGRKGKWTIDLRLHDEDRDRKLLSADLEPGGSREDGSLKPEVEQFAEERWGSAAEPAETKIHALNLVFTWIDRHCKEFMATEVFLKAMQEEEKWAAANGHAGKPLMRMLPVRILQKDATRQDAVIGEFAKILSGPYKTIITKTGAETYEEAKLEARTIPHDVTFQGKTYQNYGQARDAFRDLMLSYNKSPYASLMQQLGHRYATEMQTDLGKNSFWLANPADNLSPAMWIDYCEELECCNTLVANGRPRSFVPRLAVRTTITLTQGSFNIDSKLVEIPSGTARAVWPSTYRGSLAAMASAWFTVELTSLDDMRAKILDAWRKDQLEMRRLDQRRLDLHRYHSGYRLTYYGFGRRSYEWYYALRPEAVKSIMPELKKLSDDEIRWWYIALTGKS